MVKLHSILLRSTPDAHAPRQLKLYKNRPDLDFGTAGDLAPLASLDHPYGVGADPSASSGNASSASASGSGAVDLESEGIVEYAVNRAKFSGLTCLSIHIPHNHAGTNDDNDSDSDDDEEVTRVLYIGLRGEWTELGKAPVSITYEAAANPADHKKLVPGSNSVSESM